ncbi:MAG: F0F1 ATP synthase subunit B' [Defluviicoccus sp.]|nr:F0F1 ATP synthase subunit B' [Defluviicoccus sp.]MDG4591595.1 F0F1 ATP synthase subunit B' [Defluviicoccus sp.]MDS4073963.1 F0F1 ATP synthase subunit B' [Defluviicoccus sp.]
MPQFDPSVWSPQIIWLIVSFVALYYIMSRFVLPRLNEILEEREFRISDSLRRAENLKQEAEQAVAAYEQTMADARAKAQAQIQASHERAERLAAERQAELGDRLVDEIAAAEARIAAARTEAVAGIRDMAADVAGLAVEKLVGTRPAAENVLAAIDDTLKRAS